VHPGLDALKLLVSDGSADPRFRDRFLREAELASTLWHPHIVGVLDRGEHDGQLWISMDYVDGEDAGSLLTRRYPAGMPLDLALAIIAAVASALDYAHSQGLLHRDVKPANIMLANADDERQRRILLTDFGIARTVDGAERLTETAMTVGTVDYTAPEQLMGEDLDGRADQYALAAAAYQLFTGAPPFKDSNPAVVISRHLNSQPPPLSAIRADLKDLDDVFSVGLAKDPAERFDTCTEFARALELAAPSSDDKRTQLAPIASTLPQKPSTRTGSLRPESEESPAPLSPGWYEDPGGKLGMLYWDGHGWRSAPLPKAGPPSPVESERRSQRRVPALLVGGVAILVVAIAAIVGLLLNQRPGPSQSATSTPASVRENGASASPSLPTIPVVPAPTRTVTETITPTPSLSPTWDQTPSAFRRGVVVGTCDEGGTCGVKQRRAPYTEAPRLYSTDLHDGATVTVVCRTTGDLRASEGQGASFVWFQLNNGAYVSSVYLDIQPAEVPSC